MKFILNLSHYPRATGRPGPGVKGKRTGGEGRGRQRAERGKGAGRNVAASLNGAGEEEAAHAPCTPKQTAAARPPPHCTYRRALLSDLKNVQICLVFIFILFYFDLPFLDKPFAA